ncbi:MAG: ABC transporter permease [Spirochaetota bacterium]
MNKPLFQLVLVHLKSFWREPGILFWAFGFPLLMAWILGVAFSHKSDIVRKVGIVKNGKELTVQQSIQKRFAKSSQSRFKLLLFTLEEAKVALKQGRIQLYITQNINTQALSYHFDPNNQESYLTYLVLEQNPTSTSQIKPSSQKGERYIDFLIPGLITIGIMNSCLWGIGWSLIEFRMKKLLRRIVATPLKKWQFLLSHFLTRLIITFAETSLLLAFAYWYFELEILGSLLACIILFVVGNLTFTGIAVFVSSRASNTQVANGLVNSVTFPMMTLSGIFFSYHSFPDWVVPFIQYLPLTLFTDALRGVFTEGFGVQQILLPTSILFSYGLLFFMGGLKLYKWD